MSQLNQNLKQAASFGLEPEHSGAHLKMIQTFCIVSDGVARTLWPNGFEFPFCGLT